MTDHQLVLTISVVPRYKPTIIYITKPTIMAYELSYGHLITAFASATHSQMDIIEELRPMVHADCKTIAEFEKKKKKIEYYIMEGFCPDKMVWFYEKIPNGEATPETAKEKREIRRRLAKIYAKLKKAIYPAITEPPAPEGVIEIVNMYEAEGITSDPSSNPYYAEHFLRLPMRMIMVAPTGTVKHLFLYLYRHSSLHRGKVTTFLIC
jgi:hypothetical protein